MKKSIILFSLVLTAHFCSGQAIDAAAFSILQKSYDKLAALETISYRMVFIDSMIRENHLVVKRLPLHGTIKKNAYWHISFDNKSEWLIRGDTLYKKEITNTGPITFTTTGGSHDVLSYSIHNILGTERPALDKDISSIEFVQDTAHGEFYVIDIVVRRNHPEINGIKNLRYFNRYWVYKKSLFCKRRMMYSVNIENGKEGTDVYDFSATLETDSQAFNPGHFFKVPPLREKSMTDVYKETMLNTPAPGFSVVDVKTGKLLTLDQLKGKVVLLDFWYLSCPPCRILIPRVQQLREQFPAEDLAIIGINVTDTARQAIQTFLKEKKISFPQYYKTATLATDYKLQAFPTTLLLDRTGRIKYIEIGAGEDTIAQLELTIKEELKHK